MIVQCPSCGAKNRVDESRGRPVCGRCGSELPAASASPTVATDASFSELLQRAGQRPVLLDCWAPWCGPCHMLAPTLDALAAESAGRYLVAKLNIDENPRVTQRFGIQSIPTLLIFKNGELVDTLLGVQPKQAIAARLSPYL